MFFILKGIAIALLALVFTLGEVDGCGQTHLTWTAEPEDDCQAGHLWITAHAFRLFEHRVDCLPIIDASIGPDLFENNYWTFSGHFYDPDTGINYLGIGNSARQNFMYHIERSLDPLNLDWQKSLAWALHYLQDSCVPHHAANYTYLNSAHSQFERFARSIQSQYEAKKFVQYGVDLEMVLHDCAVIAKPFADEIENNRMWYESAEITLKQAQTRSAFVIKKILTLRGIK